MICDEIGKERREDRVRKGEREVGETWCLVEGHNTKVTSKTVYLPQNLPSTLIYHLLYQVSKAPMKLTGDGLQNWNQGDHQDRN